MSNNLCNNINNSNNINSNNNDHELYQRIRLLGEGSFGKAYLVECTSDKSLCVIKQVDLN